ncbi:MAG: NTP transferase domain-containing protein [Betaproteobacteria bacterium]|jgi:molybdenum cofactor cytidylyltransferase
MSERPVVIVMAAGRGGRFPGASHKLVQALGASTVLGTTLVQVMESRLPCVVVTTPALEPEAARVVARRDLVVIPQQEADKGMGHTMAAGVQARAQAPGWLLLPADMPLVGPGTIAAVAQALPQHTAVVAQHHGRRGHPVGFSSGLYSELMSLVGEDGLRRLLARYPAHGVEVADAGVLFDVDTEADLEAARAMVPALGLAG